MNLLLDTHIVVWMLLEPRRLPASIMPVLADPTNVRFLSIVSMWELQLKVNIGKLSLSMSVEQFVTTHCVLNNIQSLPILEEHIWTLAHLPLHHRDPFDRLLITQAVHENLTLVTVDPLFTQYIINVIN